MLNHLQIKNFTLIEKQDIEFTNGLSVITGETGSGKSLIFDALYLVLGSKINQKLIRPGSDCCIITAQFDLGMNIQAQNVLNMHDLGTQECVIRRIVYKSKPAKCEINGQIVSLKQLKELTSVLMHIHSQHASYKLCDNLFQKKLIDDFGKCNEELTQIAIHYAALKNTRQDIEKLQTIAKEQQERLAIINYHLDELYKLNLDEEPYEHIKKEYNKQNQATGFQKHLQNTLYEIDNKQNAIIPILTKTIISAEKFADTFPESSDSTELLNSAIIQLEEACRSIKSMSNSLECNPVEIGRLQDQLDLYHDLARKHNTQPENLHLKIAELEHRKQELLQVEEKLVSLTKLEQEQLSNYKKLAVKLHEKRACAATQVATQVVAMLPKLGIPKGVFKIRVKHEQQSLSIDGCDSIDFFFSANPGHEPALLKETASGGELSRISLIIELITLTQNEKTTILFDEVDTGVSGKVARDIGNVLKEISTKTQVMCITHLPQIASLADNHYTVAKYITNDKTYSKIISLNNEQQIIEVARLLGGEKIEDTAIGQAKALCEDIN
ncbi:MAG: DNA repair protein RecN [Legionellales bacterium]|nr:DNA repair protein RecN [Legionellales bacterium]